MLGWKLGVATLGMAALFLWLGIRIEPYGVPDEPDALRTDVAGRIVGWMITCLVFVLRWWCF